jgi:hypothetical protein
MSARFGDSGVLRLLRCGGWGLGAELSDGFVTIIGTNDVSQCEFPNCICTALIDFSSSGRRKVRRIHIRIIYTDTGLFASVARAANDLTDYE